jgi:hypothetical protein
MLPVPAVQNPFETAGKTTGRARSRPRGVLAGLLQPHPQPLPRWEGRRRATARGRRQTPSRPSFPKKSAPTGTGQTTKIPRPAAASVRRSGRSCRLPAVLPTENTATGKAIPTTSAAKKFAQTDCQSPPLRQGESLRMPPAAVARAEFELRTPRANPPPACGPGGSWQIRESGNARRGGGSLRCTRL